MKNSSQSKIIRQTVRAAIIAALYAALSIILWPLSFGQIQIRLSEALCVLPVFFPEAVWGLFVGCIVTNLATPNILILDIVFGSLATLVAAFLTRLLKKHPVIASLPPVIVNALIVPWIVTLSVSQIGSPGFGAAWLYSFLSVILGQAVSCCGIGIPLILFLQKLKDKEVYPFRKSDR